MSSRTEESVSDANPVLPSPDWPAPEWRMGPYWDSADEPRPATDLLSRKPTDCEPTSGTCACGARILHGWADDPDGFGSRWTRFDAEPTGGRWFMGAGGSLTFDVRHGTYRLHECGRAS